MQFQHLYNATQALLKKRDANCAYYYGLGYVAPQLRGRLTHEVLKHHPLPSVVTRVALNTMQVVYMKSTDLFVFLERIEHLFFAIYQRLQLISLRHLATFMVYGHF